MRALLVLVLVVLSVACALLAGLGAVLTRNVIEPEGFARVVVATAQSPEGNALLRGGVAREVERLAADQPSVLAAGAGLIAGDWAVAAVNSKAAARVLGPTAIGLQQGILTGTQDGTLRLDVRAFAGAADPPPLVTALLAVIPGEIAVVIPWVQVSPGFERALRLLDRRPWLPAGLAVAAAALGLVALLAARRRGLTLLALGLILAASAFLLRPLARESTTWLAAADSRDEAVAALAPVVVDAVLDGWTAVSGALTAIGLALALVGLVLGVRRRRD
ncbi:MAG: hypothetical protein ACKO2Y_06055 [Actinomycetota bacterium]